MFQKYSDQAESVLLQARFHATALLHEAISTEHIFLGLLSAPENRACRLLKHSFNVSSEQLKDALQSRLIPGLRQTSYALSSTPDAQNTLAQAVSLSEKNDHSYVGTEHLLLALTLNEKSLSGQLLKEANVTPEKVEEYLRHLPDQVLGFEHFTRRQHIENPQPFFQRNSVFTTILFLLLLGPLAVVIRNEALGGYTLLFISIVMIYSGYCLLDETAPFRPRLGKLVKFLAVIHASVGFALTVISLKDLEAAQANPVLRMTEEHVLIWVAAGWCWGISVFGYLAGDVQCNSTHKG
jgi:hypothetical protein